jgi:hypothetical protein
VVATADRRVRALVVRRGGHVIADRRRPLRVRVRAGRALEVQAVLADGRRVRWTVSRARCRGR